MSAWSCDCGVVNDGTKFCEMCGQARPYSAERRAQPVPLALPAHREFHLEKPERPSTAEDARAALAAVTTMLVKQDGASNDNPRSSPSRTPAVRPS